jgi:hypothetical protein
MTGPAAADRKLADGARRPLPTLTIVPAAFPPASSGRAAACGDDRRTMQPIHSARKRGLAMAASLLSLAACLGGCGSKPPSQALNDIRARVEAREVPPPKPPHCPTTALLAELRTADGQLEDVRIIRANDTYFYVPARWMAGYFVDAAKARYFADAPGTLDIYLGTFVPDVHEIECPGTVHAFRPGAMASRYGGFGFSTGPGRGAAPPGNATSAAVVTDVIIYPATGQSAGARAAPPEPRHVPGDPGEVTDGWRRLGQAFAFEDATMPGGVAERRTVREGNPPSELIAFQWMSPDIGLGFAFPRQAADPTQWRPLFRRMRPLFDWLTTAPRSRDNTQNFDLRIQR